MADVKWIKIVVDIFDDEKIFLIEQLPDADSIIVIWFKLLCLAGKQNNKGVFTLCETMPYTDEMFSAVFRRPLNTVRLALSTFQKFGMVEIVNGTVTIPNWGKHQNIEGMEKRREYMSAYMQQYRRDQKALTAGKQPRKHLRKQDVSDAEEEEDIEREIDTDIELDSIIPAKKPDTPPKARKKEEPKTIYAEFVSLTDNEHRNLIAEYGEAATAKMITELDNYKGSSGKKYKSDYRAILVWVVDKVKEKHPALFKKTVPLSENPF